MGKLKLFQLVQKKSGKEGKEQMGNQKTRRKETEKISRQRE